MNALICGFGNPDNRGCEAIVRTVSRMLKESHPNSYLIALSNDFGRVDMPALPAIDRYDISFYPRVECLSGIIYHASYKLFGTAGTFCRLINRKVFRRYKNIDICIAVGGDNFCYNKKSDSFLAFHKYYKRKGARLVHWGSSFEETLMYPALLKDLKRFDLIMVRESLSYNTLVNNGITEKVVLIPDPAFTMSAELPANCSIDFNKSFVGINVSPLIKSMESSKGILSRSVAELIDYITMEQNKDVLMIPHVVDRKTGTGDYSVMKEILENVKQPERCTLVGYGFTAPEYKSIISKCKIFIGARTHATIAAYSACVPTLAIGYSVKSKGISLDLFGTYENYVVPVQTLNDPQQLINAYDWIYNNRDAVRERLCTIMPAYISKAHSAADLLKSIM